MDIKLTLPEKLLALYLIDYHRYSFSVRAQGILPSGGFDTEEVRELVNLIVWCGNGMPDQNKINHMNGLHKIITRNADEIKKRIKSVRDGNISTQAFEKIDQLGIEITAADALMEYLSDG